MSIPHIMLSTHTQLESDMITLLVGLMSTAYFAWQHSRHKSGDTAVTK
jgi:hypothetical protein